MIQRRYQYWGVQGKTWTPWYTPSIKVDINNKWELKGSLKCEYRTIDK